MVAERKYEMAIPKAPHLRLSYLGREWNVFRVIGTNGKAFYVRLYHDKLRLDCSDDGYIWNRLSSDDADERIVREWCMQRIWELEL